MKSILSTCALFLLLPWKLLGETTLGPSNTRLHKSTSEDHETTQRGDEPIPFYISLKPNGEITHSPRSTRLPTDTSKDHETTTKGDKATTFYISLKPNGEITHSPRSTRLPTDTSKDHETTTKGDKATTFYISLKPNGEITHSPRSTRLHKDTSKDHETTRGDEPTIFFQEKKNEYTTEESKNVLSSKSPPQTSHHQDVTWTSHAEHLTHAMTISTGESSPSSQTPFMTEFTEIITTTPLPQNISEAVITTRDGHQTLHNLKSTNKGLERLTQGNQTTRSAELESFKPQTISTPFQKTPEVITSPTVQITETLTTKWSLLPQEKESTHLPILNITDSNGTLDIISEERNDTTTYKLKILTYTGFSTELSPTVKAEVGTTGTTETMDANVTHELITKDMITEGKHPIPHHTYPNSDNNKRQPGPIVASLIGSILLLMLVSFVVILVRNCQLKKKQIENPDWAGPSPFIEADIHPNLPIINEDGPFHHQESKRISLHSFLPHQLSKRLSMLSPKDEEVPLEDIQASSTFGHCNVQPLKEKATSNQIQMHEANSPPAELSLGSNIPEIVTIPSATENNENIQTTTKLDDEIIQTPPAEANSAIPPPFQDVDLNPSLDKNTESIPPADIINIPSPPLAPS